MPRFAAAPPNPDRHLATRLAAASALALAGCAHNPHPIDFDDAYGGIKQEAPSAYIRLREPQAEELVVVVNNNGPFGNHAGLFLGGRLSDPAGSYKHRRAKRMDWTHPRLADYVQFQSVDGMNIESYRFRLSPRAHAAIAARLEEADRALPLFCAAAVHNAIAGVGPFAAIPPVRWVTPATLADALAPLTLGPDARGVCELPDGSRCPAP
jgi:hypothetical protein